MNKAQSVTAGLAVLALCVSATVATATPSTLGFYPSTDIYAPGILHLDVDNYNKDMTSNSHSTSGLTYGFGQDTSKALGRTEAGFDYDFTNYGGTVSAGKRASFNLKTQLYDNAASGTRVVVGGWGLGTSSTYPNYGYVAGSKAFSVGRVTLGVAHGFSSNYFAATGGKTSLQLGFDRMLTKKLQFAADFYSGKGPASGVQPTLYYYVNDKADFGLGYFRLNQSGPNQNNVYVCFDYNFSLTNKK